MLKHSVVHFMGMGLWLGVYGFGFMDWPSPKHSILDGETQLLEIKIIVFFLVFIMSYIFF